MPATVGVLDGEVVVGLDEDELARFDASARKAGPRDLAAAAVQGAVGATTVGGTLVACRGRRRSGTWRRAGSAASIAAGPTRPTCRPTSTRSPRTPALVVSSGVKSLLDVPADRGAARDARRAGARVADRRAAALLLGPRRPAGVGAVEERHEAARIAAAHWELGGGGLLLGRPPDESLDDVEPLIEEALAAAADAAGIRGGAVTPFVLGRAARARAGGRTLRANRELIVGNARLAGRDRRASSIAQPAATRSEPAARPPARAPRRRRSRRRCGGP